MKQTKRIKIINDGQYLLTKGLLQCIGHEIRMKIGEFQYQDYNRLLTYLVDYFVDTKADIKPNQTISYHSWLLKFIKGSEQHYDLWEAKKNGDGFEEGVEYSIKVLIEQEEECRRHGVNPFFPTFNQKIVISKGVYDGLAVDAVRYPSPDHMSGWWVTTDLFDDNIDSLMNVYYFHVAFKRPDLLKYFALPPGYRFYISAEEKDIWFDFNALE